MRPLLHKRISKESRGSKEPTQPSDRLGDDSFHSFLSSSSDTIPQGLSTNPKSDDHFVTIVLILSSLLILIWIYCQYQFIPSSSTSHKFYTKSFYPNNNTSVLSTDFKSFTQTLHTHCAYAYLHSSSDIGDIHLRIATNVPFLQFLTVSDYGIIKPTNHQNDNVQSLLQLINVMNTHLKDNTHFIVSSGDIFYDNDVNSPHHPRWSDTFNNFIKNKIFIAAVGNKDWFNISNDIDTQSINAQIHRTNWVKNWCLPRLYYTVRFVFHDTWSDTLSFTIRFIALDTTSYLKQYDTFEYLSKQYQWLSNVLEANKNDDWIIVYGHHPFEESSKKEKHKKTTQQNKNNTYTFENLQNMKVWKKKMEEILSLLLKYDNVMMYISGHHHIWRVCTIMDKNDKLKLLTMVTGSAGRHNHHFDDNVPVHMVAGGEEESFGKISIYRHMFRVQIIDKRNETLFNHFYFKK